MKYNYAGKSIEATDSLRQRVEKKLGKLDKYFRDDAEALIRFKQQKGNRNSCELTITAGSLILRAEESSADMYQSIDAAVEKIESQIVRYRTKLEKRLRADAFTVEPDTAPVEEARYDVARVKKFPVKPMSIEDAIAQMELLGHNFFLFRNEDNDILSVLYRRNDGSYGVLEPEE
jgi:putative sigma-54 modulation protein